MRNITLVITFILATAFIVAQAKASEPNCATVANYAAQVTKHRLHGRTLNQALVWAKRGTYQRFVVETVYTLKLNTRATPASTQAHAHARVINDVRNAFYQLCANVNAAN